MPRNMSFFITTKQVRNKTKTVTRRLGWWFLKPGDIVNACVKCMGLKKGEKVEKICQIRIVKTSPEKLIKFPPSDCAREGFPEFRAIDFVEMFCKETKSTPDKIVNRIEFEYI